ncbi:3-isopropylmalate dehydratase small subunit [Roseofilum sp. BLCC_M154]|uniref:3-isopropylmalate dehydratase small subunit n=1 Tax=Roseofilum acuticapitatum BLCC-M154 TaxID=3022444 RepID=A0ABT7AS54_9CYAN|nr:3-isopropylmalate dehydratase small subunit [Roseofilum acuticapitatum]MDJ1169264.1 3-isopropylmalate dehydratase small subunit [Roseofilum acuticapitatum BLCC-M154]
MSQIQQISGPGIPLIGDDIDTDRIIPARFLRCITFDGLGEVVFQDDRAQMQGEHPFDQPQYQAARILVVNGNFGCGSSREHAPQAIARWGIQAIIGESFAEIFFGNGIAIGLPCVTASRETIKTLQRAIAANPQIELTLDLNTLTVQWDGNTNEIHLGSGAQQMFTSGTWDSCGQLLQGVDSIRATAAQLPYLQF